MGLGKGGEGDGNGGGVRGRVGCVWGICAY